jgi:hypothetical protein
LTATVVLPTPPLPLAMATRFFTPGIGWRGGSCWGCGAGGILELSPENHCLSFRAERGIRFLRIWREKLGCKIGPSWISTFDQSYFFGSREGFNLLLRSYCGLRASICVEIYQAMDSIFVGEIRFGGFSMLSYSLKESAGHADIENTRSARQDVDPIRLLHADTVKADSSLRSE